MGAVPTPCTLQTVFAHIGAAAAAAGLSDIDTHRDDCMPACRELGRTGTPTYEEQQAQQQYMVREKYDFVAD